MVTNTDKELLELAAKAAGIDGFWAEDGLNISSNGITSIWNPLTDDGDALRLEITLKLDAHWDVCSKTWGIYRDADGFYRALARDADRKRATTTAAAEIGRTM